MRILCDNLEIRSFKVVGTGVASCIEIQEIAEQGDEQKTSEPIQLASR